MDDHGRARNLSGSLSTDRTRELGVRERFAPNARNAAILIALGRVDLAPRFGVTARPADERFAAHTRDAIETLRDPIDPELLPPHSVIAALVGRIETTNGQTVWVGGGRSICVTYGAAGTSTPFADERSLGRAIRLAARLASNRRARSTEYRAVPLVRDALIGSNVAGHSITGAAFVSAISLFTDRPVLAGTAVTAALGYDRVGAENKTLTPVLPVDHIGIKMRALLIRSDTRRVVVSKQDFKLARSIASKSVEVIGVEDAQSLIDAALEPTAIPSEPTLEHAFRDLQDATRGAWDGFRFPFLLERAERLAGQTPNHRPDLHLGALTLEGAILRQVGSAESAYKVLERAGKYAHERSRDIPHAVLSAAHQHIALSRADRGLRTEARQAARIAYQAARDGRLRDDELRSLGCLARVAPGPRARARLQREALQCARTHRPSETTRSASYLLRTLALSKSARRTETLTTDEIEATFAEGRAALDHVPAFMRSSAETWLIEAYGLALVLRGNASGALPLLERISANAEAMGPLPHLRVLRSKFRCLLALGLADAQTCEELTFLPITYMTVAPREWDLTFGLAYLELARREILTRSPELARRGAESLGRMPWSAPTIRLIDDLEATL